MSALPFRAPADTAEFSSNVCCWPSVLLRAHVVLDLLDGKARFQVPHAADQRGGGLLPVHGEPHNKQQCGRACNAAHRHIGIKGLEQVLFVPLLCQGLSPCLSLFLPSIYVFPCSPEKGCVCFACFAYTPHFPLRP